MTHRIVFVLLLTVVPLEARAQQFLCANRAGPCVDVYRDEQMTPFPATRQEEVSVTIVSPHPDAQVSFDASDPGELRLRAAAMVFPLEYIDEVVWKIENVGPIRAEVTPPAGAVTEFVFRGLPDSNRHFGTKRITATVRGVSDSVQVRVFFDPQAKNNPGASGEPNWAFYWGQTQAKQGIDFTWQSAPRQSCGGTPAARYVYDDDRIYLFDALFARGCLQRSDGSRATGIDCFAEALVHEQVHRDQLRYWWAQAGVNPPDCGADTGIWQHLARVAAGALTQVDSDGDLVPSAIERGLAGCDPSNKRSCPLRPYPDLITDVDMSSYRISWSRWALGRADSEDWSRGGKQWR
jgi:hypothetical protein